MDRILELSSGTLIILPLDYNEPALQAADLINEQYPWFNNLTQWYKELGYDPSVWNNKKRFLYPHILVSYITGERYRGDNMEFIIMGEIPASYDCENL